MKRYKYPYYHRLVPHSLDYTRPPYLNREVKSYNLFPDKSFNINILIKQIVQLLLINSKCIRIYEITLLLS